MLRSFLNIKFFFISICIIIAACGNPNVVKKDDTVDSKVSKFHVLLAKDFNLDTIEFKGDTLFIAENFTDTTCFYSRDFLSLKNSLIFYRINLHFPSDFKCLQIRHDDNSPLSINFFYSFEQLYKVKETQKRDSSFVIPMTYFIRNFSCSEATELDGIYSYLASQNDSLNKYANFMQFLVGLNKKYVYSNSLENRIADRIGDAVEVLVNDTSYYVFDSLRVHYPKLMSYYRF